MGQIRGKKAKVSACNIRSLSSFGIPYAGMHILVSTDNSATEDGQGNFDAYVIGDGVTDAEELPLRSLADVTPTIGSKNSVSSNGVAEQFGRVFGIQEVELDLTIEPTNGLVTGGVFYNAGNYGTYHRCIFIPVGDYKGRTLRVTIGSGASPASYYITFLKAMPTAGASVEYADWNNAVLNITSSRDFVIPNDAEYVYFYVTDTRGSNNYLPSSAIVAGAPSEIYNKTEVDEIIDNLSVDLMDDSIRKTQSKVLYLGSNILTNPVLGDGWSGNLTNGFVHTPGNTAALSFSNTTEDGEKYLFSFKSSSVVESGILVKLGDSEAVDTYNGLQDMNVGFVSDGGVLSVIPISALSTTLTELKLQKIVSEEDSVDSVTLVINDVLSTEGENDISGFWNVAIGGKSNFTSNINGSRNIAIGNNALQIFKSGTRNIAIGTFAMSAMEEGDSNIAIGADSLWKTQSAKSSIAIGKWALGGVNPTLLERNIAIGQSAMSGNGFSASDCVAVGDHAGRQMGEKSVAIGTMAGYITTGNNNVAIGYHSYNNNNSSGDQNTIVGAEAQAARSGMSSQETISGATAVGFGASAGFTNSTALGRNAICTKPKQTVIGSTSNVETRIMGDLIVRGIDGKLRRVIFNDDFSVTWAYPDNIELTPTSTDVGYHLKADGTIYENQSCQVKTYNVTGYTSVVISGRQPGLTAQAIAVAYNSVGTVLEAFQPASGDYENLVLNLPSGTTTLKVMGHLDNAGSEYPVPSCAGVEN